jgi:hypothetical protein
VGQKLKNNMYIELEREREKLLKLGFISKQPKPDFRNNRIS